MKFIICIKIELDLRKFSNSPFSETEKGFRDGSTPGDSQFKYDVALLFHPLSTLSLKETTLSGSNWFLEISGKRSNHAPWHEIQLGKSKFT